MDYEGVMQALYTPLGQPLVCTWQEEDCTHCGTNSYTTSGTNEYTIGTIKWF